MSYQFCLSDLGFDDVGVNNPESAPYSPTVTQLSKEGLILTNAYVHWHCSPTRRSFLTGLHFWHTSSYLDHHFHRRFAGRLPIHHTEQLSGSDTDEIDLRWEILSQKLAHANYVSYWSMLFVEAPIPPHSLPKSLPYNPDILPFH